MQSVSSSLRAMLQKKLAEFDVSELAVKRVLFIVIHMLTKVQNFDEISALACLALAGKFVLDDLLIERDQDGFRQLSKRIFQTGGDSVCSRELAIIAETNACFDYPLLYDSLEKVSIPSEITSVATIKERLRIFEHASSILDAVYLRQSSLLELHTADEICDAAFFAAATVVLRDTYLCSRPSLVKKLCTIWSPSKDVVYP